MTAGAGVIHSEMPAQHIREQGGRIHGFQIWVNLPASLKMTTPRYQEVPSAEIPVAQTDDGKARVRVIAGDALGVRAKIDTHTPIVYQDWTVEAGADVTLPVPADHQAMVYVFEGATAVGDTPVRDGELAILGAGDALRLRGPDQGAGRLLLLAGRPLNEPMARYGPFVMNTQEELVQAVRDFQSGRFAPIRR